MYAKARKFWQKLICEKQRKLHKKGNIKKNVDAYGQESPGWISLFKLGTFIFSLKKSRDLNFFGKNDWLMNSGRRRAGNR